MTDLSKTSNRLDTLIDGVTESDTALVRDCILAEFVVIPRADLPEVVKVSGDYIRAGEGATSCNAHLNDDPRHVTDIAHKWLALAERIKGHSTAVAESKRNARRDELAAEITHVAADRYNDLALFARRAIDRIIQLEDAAS